MNIRPKGTVTMPRPPRRKMDILPWAKDVNSALQQLRDRVFTVPGSRGGGGGAAASTCPFGEIIDVSSGGFTKAIRGGAMLCGDKNYNVAWYGIDLTTPVSQLIQITLTGVDPASDDDDEIFLSGAVTASGTPTWGTVTYTGTENYTANTNPTTPAGTGTIVIPIGILVVAGGAATFTPVGCGTIAVGQCAGILSHSRG